MLTRRENLLVTPWQRRRYLDHRRKVQSALPAIDVSSPPYRDHVALKRKKMQREFERCRTIEHDNFILLKHLDRIMTTTRVDNCWETPPPDFLHRIAMFPVRRKTTPPATPTVLPDSPKTRKEKCVGCMPKYYHTENLVPEPRIPYDPPKPRLSRRRSSVLAQEEMKKEIDRLHALDQDRRKQNFEHFQTQRSLSSSSQRTNSAETNQSPNRTTPKLIPVIKLESASPRKQRGKTNQNTRKHRSRSSSNQNTNTPSLTNQNTSRKLLPLTNQNPKHVGQVSNLKLSTVQTFDTKNGNTVKRSKNVTGAVAKNIIGAVGKKEVKRSNKMKQIELKRDALELVLIFPAQSKVTRKKESDEECECPGV